MESAQTSKLVKGQTPARLILDQFFLFEAKDFVF